MTAWEIVRWLALAISMPALVWLAGWRGRGVGAALRTRGETAEVPDEGEEAAARDALLILRASLVDEFRHFEVWERELLEGQR